MTKQEIANCYKTFDFKFIIWHLKETCWSNAEQLKKESNRIMAILKELEEKYAGKEGYYYDENLYHLNSLVSKRIVKIEEEFGKQLSLI